MTTTDQIMPEQPIFAFAPSPAFLHDGICFAAGQGGLLKTADHGDIWIQSLTDVAGAEAIPATAVAVSPTFASDGIVLTAIPGGLGVSDDGGSSWRFAALPLPSPLVSSLAISPAFSEDGIAVAGTIEDGIFRTDDRARSWLPWNFGLLDPEVLAVVLSPHFGSDGTAYAGTSSGLYLSANRGRSWRPIGGRTVCPAIVSLAATTTDAAHIVLFAGTEQDGLWRLEHASTTVERMNDPALPETIETLTAGSGGNENGAGSILVFGDDRALVSTNGGVTWTSLANLPVRLEEITAVSPPLESDNGPIAFVGTSGGQIQRVELAAVVA